MKSTSRFSKANLLFFRDFSFPEINWQLLMSMSRDSKHFLDLCMMFNLVQVVNMPTCNGNILDLVFASSPDLVDSAVYLPGISNHKIINVLISLPVTIKSPFSKVIWDFNKANYVGIHNELTIFRYLSLLFFLSRSVEENWVLFKQKLVDLVNWYVPLLRIRGDTGQPGYDKELKTLDNKKTPLSKSEG